MSFKKKTAEQINTALTCLLILSDSVYLRDVMLTVKNPIISLGMVPTCAMFCHEADAFFSQNEMPLSISEETLKQLQVTRVRLKLFNERRLKKTRDTILGLDRQQSLKFSEPLKFKFLRKCNLYYNIGLYFDENKNLIGNTEYFASFFQDRKLTREMLGTEVFEYAKQIGSIIQSILNLFQLYIPINNKTKKEYRILYMDLNTNKDKVFAFKEDNREIELLLLHLLGSVNYALYITEEILPPFTLKFRIQYISMYYAMEQLKVVSEKSSDKSLINTSSACLDSLDQINSTQFRNCMMHYSLSNHGHFEISEEHLDFRKPFYGLIESCFDGQSFDTVCDKVKKNLKMISETLSNYLVIEQDHLKEL